MKTIVVPTDFSPAAEHATAYATGLAKLANATVLLLHVYQIPVTTNDFPVLLISGEDLKKNADESLRGAKEAAQKAAPDVTFETESRLGDVMEEITESCAQRDVLALVTGTKELSSFERFLLGNTALSIAKNSSYPVITVPEGAPLAPPKKIAIGIDDNSHLPVEKIKSFLEVVEAQLHLVHIQTDKESENVIIPEAFKDATYHVLKNDDVSEGLESFASQHSIDLVLVMPHKHTLMERIFFKGHTNELINELPIPVMCIQAEE